MTGVALAATRPAAVCENEVKLKLALPEKLVGGVKVSLLKSSCSLLLKTVHWPPTPVADAEVITVRSGTLAFATVLVKVTELPLAAPVLQFAH